MVHEIVDCLCGEVRDAVASRPACITKLSSKNRLCQVVAENTLVQALIPVAKSLKEGGNSNILVIRAWKMD